jgi:DNA polymerase I
VSLDDVTLHLVDSIDEAFAFKRWVGERRPTVGDMSVIGVDTETTGLSQLNDQLRLVQVGDGQTGWAIPWAEWGGVAREILTQWEGHFVFHNAPFDRAFLERLNVKIPTGRVLDTRPMFHVLEPTYSTALKNLASRYVDPRAKAMQDDLDDAIGKKGGWTWGTVPIRFAKYWQYGALDPVLTYRLLEEAWPRLHADGSMPAYELESSVQWVIQRMSHRGAHVDRRFAHIKHGEFVDYCAQVQEWCLHTYGISAGSDIALIEVLQREGVEFTKYTKSGTRLSLDAEVLESIDHPLAQAVLQRRRLQKIASTYLAHIVNEADADDLMHPDINPLGARTSRMSMANPNLQNLPRASETNTAAKTVRDCYTTRYDDNGTMVFCDFDQIEMRGLAHMSGDQGLRDAFLSPGDFFVNLARRVYRDDTIEKKHPLRQRVKNVGYAKIYGAGTRKMAITAGIPEEEMAISVHAFDAEFPGVRLFQNRVQRVALERKAAEGMGYVRSPLTQRRHPSDSGKEYALVNYLVQGLAAEMFKMKILELDAAGLGEFMVLPVHDEIILDVRNESLPEVIDTLQKVMNDDKLLSVPITAGIATGARWGSKQDYTTE